MTQHLSSTYSPERQTAQEILAAEKSGAAVKFFEFYVDDFKNVTWTVYGNCKTNEITLVASGDTIAVGIAESSRVLFPKMHDRVFGMPQEDLQLLKNLVSKLSILCCAELKTQDTPR